MSRRSEIGGQATRRTFFARMGVIGATLLGAGAAARDALAAKMPKKTAQYQDTPKNGQKCVDCVHFVEGGACKLVEGEINPEGWCALFSAKS